MSERTKHYTSLTLPERVKRLRRYAYGLAIDRAVCPFGEVVPLLRLARGELSCVLWKLMEEDAQAKRPFFSALFVSGDPYKAEQNGGHHLPGQNFFDMAEMLKGGQLYRRFGEGKRSQETEGKVAFWKQEVECCYAFADSPKDYMEALVVAPAVAPVVAPVVATAFEQSVKIVPVSREPAVEQDLERLKRVFTRRRIDRVQLQN